MQILGLILSIFFVFRHVGLNKGWAILGFMADNWKLWFDIFCKLVIAHLRKWRTPVSRGVGVKGVSFQRISWAMLKGIGGGCKTTSHFAESRHSHLRFTTYCKLLICIQTLTNQPKGVFMYLFASPRSPFIAYPLSSCDLIPLEMMFWWPL